MGTGNGAEAKEEPGPAIDNLETYDGLLRKKKKEEGKKSKDSWRYPDCAAPGLRSLVGLPL